MPGLPPRQPNDGSLNGRFDRWVKGWLLGKQGISGAGHDLASSVDPRTPAGLINALAMFAGKPSGENALAAHLGHSEFRPYGIFNPNRNRNDPIINDPMTHGGALSGGQDYGYPNPDGFVKHDIYKALQNIKNQPDRPIHSPGLKPIYDAIQEADPNRLPDSIIRLLQAPYRSYKGLRN